MVKDNNQYTHPMRRVIDLPDRETYENDDVREGKIRQAVYPVTYLIETEAQNEDLSEEYGQKFSFKDPRKNEPIKNLFYYVIGEDGQTIEGSTDRNGETPRFVSKKEGYRFDIYKAEYPPTRMRDPQMWRNEKAGYNNRHDSAKRVIDLSTQKRYENHDIKGDDKIREAVYPVTYLIETEKRSKKLSEDDGLKFSLKDREGNPIKNFPYYVIGEDGQVIKGMTNENGETPRFFTQKKGYYFDIYRAEYPPMKLRDLPEKCEHNLSC